MTFEQALKTKKFIVTAEIFPPKGVDLSLSLKKAEKIKDFVDAINVTDNQRAVMRMNPLVLCHKLSLMGIDSIYQVACRDRNVMGLSSDLLAAYALGIRNILAVTGDYPLRGSKLLTKPVFEADSVQLLDLIKKLESGIDANGAQLESSPKFIKGAVVNPTSDLLDLQIIKLKKKIDLGASFIQTQVVFDIDAFKKFRDKTSNLNAKFLVGIFPLKSFQVAKFLAEKVPGVKVPQKILDRIEKSSDQFQEGIKISIDTVNQLKDYCDGIHLMTMNDENLVSAILKNIKI